MNQVESIAVRVPVNVLGEAHFVAVKIYKSKNEHPKKAVFCFPGGSYNKCYFDIFVNNGENYSLAKSLANDGNIVICVDHLGVGDSTKPADGGALTRSVLADAGATAADYVIEGLEAGTLIPAWPPIADIPRVGVGHSLGGLVLLSLQARHKTFDAIAILGWSNQPMSVAHDIFASEPYVQVDRTILRPFFHLDDVPENIIVADDLNAERVPSGILVEGQRANISKADAQTVAVPVFICYGERDLCPNPHLEPSTYPNSDDITMFRLMNSAHNHNFASSRLEFFRRLSSWIDSCHDNRLLGRVNDLDSRVT
jgi:pimeloyl-ACP methyl ester carboxylesterase